jgi:CheY-like chemotaxis protein
LASAEVKRFIMTPPILMIEDSEEEAALFSQLLKSVGVINHVTVMKDGREALRYLVGELPFSDRAKYPMPHALILDISLPGKDGFEILKWIRSQPECKDLPVFVVSGSDDLGTIRRAYELGANSFLAKPYKQVDVANLVHGFPQHWSRATKASI